MVPDFLVWGNYIKMKSRRIFLRSSVLIRRSFQSVPQKCRYRPNSALRGSGTAGRDRRVTTLTKNTDGNWVIASC